MEAEAGWTTFCRQHFQMHFCNENLRISIKISLKCVPKGPVNNIPALVQIMAWRQPGDTPLSEPMMVRLLRHICVTRPQWVKVITLPWTVDKPLLEPIMTWFIDAYMCHNAVMHCLVAPVVTRNGNQAFSLTLVLGNFTPSGMLHR